MLEDWQSIRERKMECFAFLNQRFLKLDFTALASSIFFTGTFNLDS
jgi:hypothetical protein